jgi:hypothetical protein
MVFQYLLSLSNRQFTYMYIRFRKTALYYGNCVIQYVKLCIASENTIADKTVMMRTKKMHAMIK